MLGDAMDDVATDTAGASDPTILQIHAVAQQIGAVRTVVNAQLSTVANADATVDWATLTSAITQLAQLSAQFNTMVAAYNAANPYALGPFDQAVLDMGTWAQETYQVLGSAMAAIPNQIISGLGSIANHATAAAAMAVAPLLVLGAAAVGLLLFAEKSPGVRRAETAYIK